MFEEHYTELATAVDDIAERIRTLDVPAPGTYKAFAQLSKIEEVDGVPSAEDMVDILTRGHEQVVKTCREVLKLAGEAEDESTVALVWGSHAHSRENCLDAAGAESLIYRQKVDRIPGTPGYFFACAWRRWVFVESLLP